MKPDFADPNHPLHQYYRPESDDYPHHEAPLEQKWKETKGVDENGKAWLTPRMQRNADRLAETWQKQDSTHPKSL
jgi:hypothetical protein